MKKHLWEVNHPYYATEGNYYSNEEHMDFETWDEFYEAFGNTDLDLNLLYRWDWKAKESKYDKDLNEIPIWSSDDTYPDGELYLFWIGQRKAKAFSSRVVNIAKAEEEKVLQYLEPRWKKLESLWEPMSEKQPLTK